MGRKWVLRLTPSAHAAISAYLESPTGKNRLALMRLQTKSDGMSVQAVFPGGGRPCLKISCNAPGQTCPLGGPSGGRKEGCAIAQLFLYGWDGTEGEYYLKVAELFALMEQSPIVTERG